MKLKQFFSFKTNRFFWLNIAWMIIFVIAAIIVTFRWLDSYTMHGHSVAVPDLHGMSIDEASTLLRERKLKFAVTDSSYIKGMPARRVLQVIPASGSKVKEGRTVYLTVSSARVPLIKVPDIVDNSSLREAEARLKAAGFNIGKTEFVANEAKDWVVGIKFNGTELSRGTSVPEGATLVIVAGMGGGTSIFDNDAIEADIESVAPAFDDDSWFR